MNHLTIFEDVGATETLKFNQKLAITRRLDKMCREYL